MAELARDNRQHLYVQLDNAVIEAITAMVKTSGLTRRLIVEATMARAAGVDHPLAGRMERLWREYRADGREADR